MTTVEILKHHLKNRIDFGYFPFSDWSNMINDALEAAIAVLEQPAPVYHYLPEVPENEANVIVYEKDFADGLECKYIQHPIKGKMGYFQTPDGEYVSAYAWTRIPPKPPVKPTEEQP